MKPTQVINQAFSIVFRNKPLWILALISLSINIVIGILFPYSYVTPIITGIFIIPVTAFMTGALIWMVNSIADQISITVKDGFIAGKEKFISLLLFIRLILTGPLWILTIILSFYYFYSYRGLGQSGALQTANYSSNLGGVIGASSLVMILFAVVGAIAVGAERAVVLDNLSIGNALRKGINLIIKKYKDFLKIGLGLFVVFVVILILFGCLTSIFTSPFMQSEFTSPGAFGFPQSPRSITPATMVIFVIRAVVNLIIGVFITLLTSSVWTLTYRHWQGKEPLRSPSNTNLSEEPIEEFE